MVGSRPIIVVDNGRYASIDSVPLVQSSRLALVAILQAVSLRVHLTLVSLANRAVGRVGVLISRGRLVLVALC